MHATPVVSPDLRPNRRVLAEREGLGPQTAMVDAYPAAIRGLLIGAGVALSFWGMAATVIWRLVVAR